MSDATGTAAGAVVLDPATIDRLPWSRLHDRPTVLTRVLWRQRESLAGIIRLPATEQLPAHTHGDAHHHVLVLQGTARILGATLPPGSYVHIPAGVAHAVEVVGADELVMLYLYVVDSRPGRAP
jgi:quercetin dioxygenase-like cupin family protein